MKRYELFLACMLFMLSTLMKICSIALLCASPKQVEELPPDPPLYTMEKKAQQANKPLINSSYIGLIPQLTPIFRKTSLLTKQYKNTILTLKFFIHFHKKGSCV